MISKRYFLVPLLLMFSAAVFLGGYSEAEVLCKDVRSDNLRARPDKCRAQEKQVDPSDIGLAPHIDPSLWSWLGEGEGTYWYVPPENLLAVEWDSSDPQNYSRVSDQTVWRIERYENGYFFGTVVVQLGVRPPICQYMIGSVTPNGMVYIAFNPLNSVPIVSPSLTTGIGQMVLRDGEWVFNMQMATGSASNQIEHWAYMLECKPDEACWTDLPGVQRSIPDFLSNCDD